MISQPYNSSVVYYRKGSQVCQRYGYSKNEVEDVGAHDLVF